MNILSRNKPSVQFRCRLVAGALRYEQIISVAGGVNNYQEVNVLVVQAARHAFYHRPESCGVN